MLVKNHNRVHQLRSDASVLEPLQAPSHAMTEKRTIRAIALTTCSAVLREVSWT